MLDFKICQQLCIFILRGQAGISQIARDIRPILKTSIVKILQVVRYDERHYPVGQAFLEHDKTSRPSIPILKRMNRLELLVKVNDIVQCLLLLGVIRLEQYAQHGMHLLRWTSLISTYLIGKLLTITHIKPGFPAVRSSGFQDTVYFLNHSFRKFILRVIYDIINTTEMIHRLHDVINIDRFIRNADGVRLINLSGLFM